MLSPVVPQADGTGASSEQSVVDPADSVQATPDTVLSESPLAELVTPGTPESMHAELVELLRADGFGITSSGRGTASGMPPASSRERSAIENSSRDLSAIENRSRELSAIEKLSRSFCD